MNPLRRHWYNSGLFIAIGLIAFVAIRWLTLDLLQNLSLLNFVAMRLHPFEEYGRPGGGPWIRNKVAGKSDQPDRYPLNHQQFHPKVDFDDVPWLGDLGVENPDF